MPDSFPAIPTDLEQRVLHALRHWHDGESADGLLVDLLLFRQAARSETGTARQANNVVLRQTLSVLRRQHAADADLLELRFLDNWPVDRIAVRLNFSESTVYTHQHQALLRLVAVLRTREAEAWKARQAQVDARIEAPIATHLIGVDAQIEALADLVIAPAAPWIVSVEGIGGIGKTVLAGALVRRASHSLAFDDFAWASAQPAILDLRGTIRAKERPALSATALVTALLQQLMPAEATGVLGAPEQALSLLKNRLKHAPHLVVIDNLETIADLEALMPVLHSLADPTKFVLTTRQRLIGERDIYLYPVPELSETHAFALVRQTAQRQNAADLAAASDDDLHPLYATVGGNPLALLLVVGQTQLHGLDTVLHDLRAARGAPVANLYTFIYRRAWDSLDELGRRVLLTMSLVNVRGDTLEFIAATSDLPPGDVVTALQHLIMLNLVNPAGDLHHRRYQIHSLTRAFLHEQVAKWA